MADDRESLGRIVRETWVAWAFEQPDAGDHPSWTKPYEELAERDREVDMRIGSAIAARAVADAKLECTAMRRRLVALSIHFPAIRDALTRAAADAEYQAQAGPFLNALEALESTGPQERSDEEASRGH